jgi:threonine/homoserine/homoserine lactone efflux protein
MSPEVLLALIAFAFAASITPGPNNLMLLASGVNFGFRRTVPHMLGIAAGFCVLLLAVGGGLGALIERSPAAFIGLKVLGGGYLLYLAWRIATTRKLAEAEADGRPLRFFEAAAFQWVNPKAWVMAIAGMAAYTNPQDYLATMLMVCGVFTLVNLPSLSVWAAFGMGLRGWLAEPARLKWFNIAMGALLALSLWPMLR